ncbi:MAG: hypothetical protein MJ016_05080 [Victivallaceae bacterium]|nr:hypothetical protein [Victivallaceae bacterium]
MMKAFFRMVLLSVFGASLTAADIGGKLDGSLWEVTRETIETELPGFVQGSESGLFYRLGAEEKVEVGNFSCGEALLAISNGKVVSLHLIAYRKRTSDVPLGEADFAALSRSAQQEFSRYFPKKTATLSDRYQEMTVSGTVYSGEGGDMVLSEARTGKGPMALIVSVFYRNDVPRQLSAYIRDVLDLRYTSVFDAENNARIYTIPEGETGVKDMGLSSTAVRLARFYGVKASQQIAQESIGDDGKDSASTIRLFRCPRHLENKCSITCREVMDGENLMTKKKRERVEKDYDRIVQVVNKKSHERDRAKRKKDMDLDDDDDELVKFPTIDPEIFIRARAANKPGMARFWREADTALERGNPLLWCVMEYKTDKAGKAQTGVPKLAWKILCGINRRDKKLFFIDCYTHPEPVELSLEEAWAITLKLYQISERK